MIHREAIFRILEDAGRADTGGREALTFAQVHQAYGGPRSGATRRMSEELGITPREVQRIVKGERGTGGQTRGAGSKAMRYFREMSDRELRRAGARYFRDNPLTIAEGSFFALCYLNVQQGDEREIQGDPVTLADNDVWLDHFWRGDRAEAAGDRATANSAYYSMERTFTDAFLEAYGVEAGDVDVCDEDGGQNLAVEL